MPGTPGIAGVWQLATGNWQLAKDGPGGSRSNWRASHSRTPDRFCCWLFFFFFCLLIQAILGGGEVGRRTRYNCSEPRRTLGLCSSCRVTRAECRRRACKRVWRRRREKRKEEWWIRVTILVFFLVFWVCGRGEGGGRGLVGPPFESPERSLFSNFFFFFSIFYFLFCVFWGFQLRWGFALQWVRLTVCLPKRSSKWQFSSISGYMARWLHGYMTILGLYWLNTFPDS